MLRTYGLDVDCRAVLVVYRRCGSVRRAAVMSMKLNRRMTTCAKSGRQRRSAAASVGIRTSYVMISATIWAESMMYS